MASNTKCDQDWQLNKKTVLERNSHMFNNPLMSDIKFTCGESEGELMRKLTKFHAHKYVLATSSPVFHAMFYGDLAEKNSVIHLPAEEKVVEAFLRFLYTDKCTTDAEIALKIISKLAKEYKVPSLEEKCWEVVDANVSKVINSSVFYSLDQGTLQAFLERETLVFTGNSGEVALFKATLQWCNYKCGEKGLKTTAENTRAVLGDAIHHIRFLAMTQEEFSNEVSTSGFLTDKEVIAYFQSFIGPLSPSSHLTCSLPRRRGNSFACMPCYRFSKSYL